MVYPKYYQHNVSSRLWYDVIFQKEISREVGTKVHTETGTHTGQCAIIADELAPKKNAQC